MDLNIKTSKNVCASCRESHLCMHVQDGGVIGIEDALGRSSLQQETWQFQTFQCVSLPIQKKV
jgi:hypothetical protein